MSYIGKWRFHSIGVINEAGNLTYMNAEEYINSPMPYIDENGLFTFMTIRYEKEFFKDRLYEKEYIPFSYFDGATPDNGYTPSAPMTIAIYENPYSFVNENWATLWVKSGGADNMPAVKLRQKPSTGQWFLNDIQCLSEIRVTQEADPWA